MLFFFCGEAVFCCMDDDRMGMTCAIIIIVLVFSRGVGKLEIISRPGKESHPTGNLNNHSHAADTTTNVFQPPPMYVVL